MKSPADSIIYSNQLVPPYALAVGQTLPYLSDLHIFSYGFTAEGTLIPPPADDTRMIEAARTASVCPILTLTPFGPDDRFSNTLISSVVRNPSYRQNLIWQLFAAMRERDFAGVDVNSGLPLQQSSTASALWYQSAVFSYPQEVPDSGTS